MYISNRPTLQENGLFSSHIKRKTGLVRGMSSRSAACFLPVSRDTQMNIRGNYIKASRNISTQVARIMESEKTRQKITHERCPISLRENIGARACLTSAWAILQRHQTFPSLVLLLRASAACMKTVPQSLYDSFDA